MGYREERSLREVFTALVDYLREHHPAVADSLRPPATESQIENLEQLIGDRLPEDVRELYLLADGQGERQSLFVEGFQFLPLAEVGRTWQMMSALHQQLSRQGGTEEGEKPQGPVRDLWWHPRWIPFAYHIRGDHYCIDLSPAPGGEIGQILDFIHDDTPRRHLGFSITDFLGELEQGLRSGRYLMDPDSGAFDRREVM